MRKISLFIVSALLLLSVFASAQRKGSWEFYVTAYINHNNMFHDPTPHTPSTYSFCFDCSAFQSYPTFGFGGGFLADRVYKNNLVFRTGLIFTQYNFIEKLGKAMADYYYDQGLGFAYRRDYFSIEDDDSWGIFEIPMNLGYSYKNLKMFIGVELAPLAIHNSKTILYSGETLKYTDITFGLLPNATLQYFLAKYRTDIFIGVDYNFRQFNFYNIGISYQLYKQ